MAARSSTLYRRPQNSLIIIAPKWEFHLAKTWNFNKGFESMILCKGTLESWSKNKQKISFREYWFPAYACLRRYLSNILFEADTYLACPQKERIRLLYMPASITSNNSFRRKQVWCALRLPSCPLVHDQYSFRQPTTTSDSEKKSAAR